MVKTIKFHGRIVILPFPLMKYSRMIVLPKSSFPEGGSPECCVKNSERYYSSMQLGYCTVVDMRGGTMV